MIMISGANAQILPGAAILRIKLESLHVKK